MKISELSKAVEEATNAEQRVEAMRDLSRLIGSLGPGDGPLAVGMYGAVAYISDLDKTIQFGPNSGWSVQVRRTARCFYTEDGEGLVNVLFRYRNWLFQEADSYRGAAIGLTSILASEPPPGGVK